MRIAICDNDKSCRKTIENNFLDYQKKSKYQIDFSINFYDDDIHLLKDMKTKGDYKIVFISTSLVDVDVIELSKEIKKLFNGLKIVIISDTAEFALRAYEIPAFDYILKPVEQNKINTIINKLIEENDFFKNETVVVEMGKRGFRNVYIHNIEFIEAIGHSIIYHLRDGEIIKARSRLLDVEKSLLKHKRFIRTQRSFILNMDCIESFENGSFKTVHSNKIPVSRTNYQTIMDTYLNYFFDKRR